MPSVDACDFFAGWVGGAAGVISSHPLDTVKVRLQTSTSFKGTMDCCLKTMQREGASGFFRGMSFPLLSVAAYNALVFGVYSNTTRMICQWRYSDPNHQASFFDMSLAAMFAGGVSVAVGSPVDLVKIRLQSQTGTQEKCGKTFLPHKPRHIFLSKGDLLNPVKSFNVLPSASVRSSAGSPMLYRQQAPSKQQRYRGPLDCIGRIYKEDGIRGFYRGGGPAMVMRDVPGYVIYFLPYAVLSELFLRRGEKETGPLGLIMAGGLAGVLSWGIMHPMDTVKSRLQINGNGYNGVFDCIRKSYQTEGISVFFRGLPVNALRGFPQSAALFFGYEMSMRVMRG